MRKQELVAAIAAKAEISKKAAENALDALIAVIGDSLAEGNKVQLVGFGTFEVRTRNARTGRNPSTGETVEIAAACLPAFKAGKALRDRVAK